jgi:hypothetical protein
MGEPTEIKEGNRRVELDKAWETSVTRRTFIGALTYLVACFWLIHLESEKPFLNALVPVAGYILSTLSLPFLKRWWLKNHNHDDQHYVD